jgi:hypothetical protein
MRRCLLVQLPMRVPRRCNPLLRLSSSNAPPTASAASAAAGYQGFGSFHVEHSVEDMIRMTDAEFAAAVPDTHRHLSLPSPPSVPSPSALDFGAAVRHRLFPLVSDDDCTFLNHGAFGCPIAQGLHAASAWRVEAERQPLRFMDRTLLPELVRTTRLVAARVLGAAPADTTLVTNATTGLNAVFASLRRHGLLRSVLFLDCAYGADKAMARFYAQDGVVEVPVLAGLASPSNVVVTGGGGGGGGDCGGGSSSPTESLDAYILCQVERALKSQKRPGAVSLAVFDHVTSNTALRLPIGELTQLCHAHGVAVLVDGAHTVGQVSGFHLGTTGGGAGGERGAGLGRSAASGAGGAARPTDEEAAAKPRPDFFVGNFHKWFLAPRGSGFLWCNPHTRPPAPAAATQQQQQLLGGGGTRSGGGWTDIVRHPILSHGGNAGFHSSFSWFGNADYSPLLALRAVTEAVWLAGDARPSGGSGSDSGGGGGSAGGDVEAQRRARQGDHHDTGTAAAAVAENTHLSYMSTLLADAADLVAQRWGHAGRCVVG